MLENNPRNISARRHGMGLSAARFNRITCEELRRYPYKKIKVRQQLQEKDFQNFGYWFLQQCNKPRFLSKIVIGAEASFAVNSAVNTGNVREYATKGQVARLIYERSDSREKITVWAGLCGNVTLLGPYIMDGTVNGNNYLQMINDFDFPQLQEHFNNQFDGVLQRLWWFQDGAS